MNRFVQAFVEQSEKDREQKQSLFDSLNKTVESSIKQLLLLRKSDTSKESE